jgi:hypothetical protein
MNLNEVLDAVQRLGEQERDEWLIDLAAAMTISARAGYPAAGHASHPRLFAVRHHAKGAVDVWNLAVPPKSPTQLGRSLRTTAECRS